MLILSTKSSCFSSLPYYTGSATQKKKANLLSYQPIAFGEVVCLRLDPGLRTAAMQIKWNFSLAAPQLLKNYPESQSFNLIKTWTATTIVSVIELNCSDDRNWASW